MKKNNGKKFSLTLLHAIGTIFKSFLLVGLLGGIAAMMIGSFIIFKTIENSGNFIKDKNDEYIQVPSMQDIQYLGALNTYYKRYLYLNAFGITDGEIIDSMDNNNLTSKNDSMEKKQVKIKSLATEDQIKRIKSLYNEEEQKKALEIVKKSKIEDLTVLEASQLISKRGEK